MATLSLLETLTPVSQGAEAKVYKCHLHGPDFPPILVKHRFEKGYRHPTLDTSLTKGRVAGEARMLMKCLRSGVRVPGLRMVDAERGVIGIEWIDGQSLRVALGADEEGIELEYDGEAEEETIEDDAPDLSEYGLTIDELMTKVGTELAKMHMADVIHGDLTTSNMMLRPRPDPSSSSSPKSEVVIIDFGLAFVSNLVEDKAVDLYVLERAFASTHPDSEPWFDTILQAYAKQSGKAWNAISNRLDQVRLRGRKRSMVG
ncbi:hypothetical protein M422DRAFT_73981 [Sphaerobolus stellatus SS14]|nr:hypothetical protein M422DRAFT_73981 [Sphaerobolus stellatus SS14]